MSYWVEVKEITERAESKDKRRVQNKRNDFVKLYF